MTTSHLQNTIRLLLRVGALRRRAEEHVLMQASMFLHGEAALDAVESEQTRLFVLSLEEYCAQEFPTFKAMVEELGRRLG